MILINNNAIPAFFVGKKSVERIFHVRELVWERDSVLTDGDFIWLTENNETHIIYYIGDSLFPIIPGVINGNPVTVLESTAFNYSDIRSAVIPDGVTAIY